MKYKVPKANPSVRDRINLTNAKLRSAAGDIGLLVDGKCKELIQDFEQVCFKGDTGQIDKDRDRLTDARIGCSGLSDLAGMPQVAAGRGTFAENDIAMETINREHPEYVARKAIWKQYEDLYAGGEQLRTNASLYLVTAAQGTGRDLPGTAGRGCSTKTTSDRSSTGMRRH